MTWVWFTQKISIGSKTAIKQLVLILLLFWIFYSKINRWLVSTLKTSIQLERKSHVVAWTGQAIASVKGYTFPSSNINNRTASSLHLTFLNFKNLQKTRDDNHKVNFTIQSLQYIFFYYDSMVTICHISAVVMPQLLESVIYTIMRMSSLMIREVWFHTYL